MNILDTRRAARPSVLGLALISGCSAGKLDTNDSSLPGPLPEGCVRSDAYDQDAMTEDLAYLASPELDGRAPGSTGDAVARDFVAERFECLGLTRTGTGDGYEQRFTDAEGNETGNVLGMIVGSRSSLADEVIVVSAHIDHFGDGWLGANDNASGVTALLAIAASMVNEDAQPERTVVFAAFGAEESGYEGSEHFMEEPPSEIEVDRIVYNVNMDMVGSYLSSSTLYALGTFQGTAGREAVHARSDEHPTIDISLGDGSDLSDNYAFCTRGIPYVFFWTEDTDCYHERCDRSELIDYDALPEIASLSGAVALDLASSDEDLLGGVNPNRDVCY